MGPFAREADGDVHPPTPSSGRPRSTPPSRGSPHTTDGSSPRARVLCRSMSHPQDVVRCRFAHCGSPCQADAPEQSARLHHEPFVADLPPREAGGWPRARASPARWRRPPGREHSEQLGRVADLFAQRSARAARERPDADPAPGGDQHGKAGLQDELAAVRSDDSGVVASSSSAAVRCRSASEFADRAAARSPARTRYSIALPALPLRA